MTEPTTQPQNGAPQGSGADAVLAVAYQTAPAHIKAYLDSGQLADVVLHLQNTYGLHIDVTEKVAKELVLTLLGIVPPTEFPINLRVVAKIQEAYIEPIVSDVNRLIFIPLGEQTRIGETEPPAQVQAKPSGTEWVNVTASTAPAVPPVNTGVPSLVPQVAPAPSYGAPPAPAPSTSYQQPATPASVTRRVPTGYESVLKEQNTGASQTPPPVPPPVASPVYQPQAQQFSPPAPTPQVAPPPSQSPRFEEPATPSASPLSTFHMQARTMAEDMAVARQGGDVPPKVPEYQPTPNTPSSPPVPQSPRPTAPPPFQEQRLPSPPITPPRVIPPAYQDVVPRPSLPQAPQQGQGYAPPIPPPHIPGNDPYREPVE